MNIVSAYTPSKSLNSQTECVTNDEYEDEYDEFTKAKNEQEYKNPVVKHTESVNIGTEEDPKLVRIDLTSNPTEKSDLISKLREFMGVFAWSYRDMPVIDWEIA